MKDFFYSILFFSAFCSTCLFSNTTNFAEVAKNALSSTVFIVVETDSFNEYFGEESYEYQYLRPYYEFLWPSLKKGGSGAIIDPRGYIITNAHVVKNGINITVFASDLPSRKYKAILMGMDERTDLAVLKIRNKNGEPFPFISLGDSNLVRAGEPVIAIGNPGGSLCQSTVTSGIVSAKERSGWNLRAIEDYLQIDSPINPGNSGGPLLNSQGELIGVAAWQYSHHAGIVGLNFAIPSHIVKAIAPQLIANREIEQGFLGVKLDMDPDFEYYNCGAIVEQVLKNSPAELAGVEFEDIIVELNGIKIESSLSLRNKIAILTPGTEIILTVNRNGKLLNVFLVLGEEREADAFSHMDWIL